MIELAPRLTLKQVQSHTECFLSKNSLLNDENRESNLPPDQLQMQAKLKYTYWNKNHEIEYMMTYPSWQIVNED